MKYVELLKVFAIYSRYLESFLKEIEIRKYRKIMDTEYLIDRWEQFGETRGYERSIRILVNQNVDWAGYEEGDIFETVLLLEGFYKKKHYMNLFREYLEGGIKWRRESTSGIDYEEDIERIKKIQELLGKIER